MVHSWGSGPPEPSLGPVSLPFGRLLVSSVARILSVIGCVWVFGCVACVILLLVHTWGSGPP
jgi:hypothetical protein